MDRIVVTNSHLISYSGEVIFEGESNEFIGLRPSVKSEVCVFFRKSDIYRIIYSNGRNDIYNEIQDSQAPEEITDQSILVKLNNGASFRGAREESIWWMHREDGFFLYPIKSKNIFFWIPESEIKKIYREDKQVV